MLLVFLAGSAVTQAQYRGGQPASQSTMRSGAVAASPLAPPPSVLHPAPSRWWIGPQAGANLNSHDGDFVTDFCECAFEDGSGTGLAIGIEAGHFLSNSIAVALKLVYNDLRADYSYQLLQDGLLPDNTVVEDVLFERQNTVVLGYLMIHPVIQLHPIGGFYLFGGPAIGFNMSATQDYTLLVVDERFAFDVGDPESREVLKDSGDLPGANGIRADLRFGAGYNLRLSRSILFAPEISYGYPLTNISDDDNWSASAIHVIGVFKFEL
ncbi:outer membrane beta-barrel protein [bacterium]|nr:outer membrane beta-barrel protein [bacterium]